MSLTVQGLFYIAKGHLKKEGWINKYKLQYVYMCICQFSIPRMEPFQEHGILQMMACN